MKQEKNSNFKLSILIVVLLLAIVGVSFAYYFANLRGKNINKISTPLINLTYSEIGDGLNQVHIYNDQLGVNSYNYIEFTIQADSDNRGAVAYAIYLDESEYENNLDKRLIHYYLSDSSNRPVLDYGNKTIEYCAKKTEEGYTYAKYGEYCDSDQLIVKTELTPEEYKLDYPEHNLPATVTKVSYIEQFTDVGPGQYGYDIEPYCSRTVYYQYENDPEYGNNLVGTGKGDGDKCEYYNVVNYETTPFPLKSDNESETYFGMMKNRLLTDPAYNSIISAVNMGDFDNLIYLSVLGSGNEDNIHEAASFRLRYWISAEEVYLYPREVVEGEDQGSITATIGEDATFKFKIGVYAVLANPS